MKKKSIFFTLLILVSSLLTSCKVTQEFLWGGPYSVTGTVDSFFIDKENQRIILIGVGKFDKIKDNYHYSIQDQSGGRLIKIFEIAQKSGDVSFSIPRMETTGSEVKGSFGIGFKRQNLSPEDLKIAEEEGLTKVSNKTFLGRPCRFDNATTRWDHSNWPLAQSTRYPSSKEPIKNLCLYEKPEYKEVPYEIFDKNGKYLRTLKQPRLQLVSQPKLKSSNSSDCIPVTLFNEPWKGPIRDNYTTSDKAIRIAATPFAVIADILLTPIYIIGVIGMGVGGK